MALTYLSQRLNPLLARLTVRVCGDHLIIIISITIIIIINIINHPGQCVVLHPVLPDPLGLHQVRLGHYHHYHYHNHHHHHHHLGRLDLLPGIRDPGLDPLVEGLVVLQLGLVHGGGHPGLTGEYFYMNFHAYQLETRRFRQNITENFQTLRINAPGRIKHRNFSAQK